jgi:hypothetical protein
MLFVLGDRSHSGLAVVLSYGRFFHVQVAPTSDGLALGIPGLDERRAH